LFTNLTPFKLLFSNPIPFIPFPLTRGRGISDIREASPLFDSPLKEKEEILERGFTPLLPALPLPLIREGGQGDRLLNNFL